MQGYIQLDGLGKGNLIVQVGIGMLLVLAISGVVSVHLKAGWTKRDADADGGTKREYDYIRQDKSINAERNAYKNKSGQSETVCVSDGRVSGGFCRFG